jgi:PiT family inorganic phosphate transporter
LTSHELAHPSLRSDEAPVKIAVATIALGLGTMVGWKRIVVTVGEKIGKTRLTYAQCACAEITAAATIATTDGVDHTRAFYRYYRYNGRQCFGLQLTTVWNIALTRALTTPAATANSGTR